MSIDTRKVQGRRKVQYASLQDLLADAERMSSGNAQTLGNWSAGQIFAHLAQSMNNSIDGSDIQIPWYIRVPARLLKRWMLKGPMPPGFKISDTAARSLVPGPTSIEDGLVALRNAIARQERETTRAPNPVLGSLTLEDWTQLHLTHAALHMSFLAPQK